MNTCNFYYVLGNKSTEGFSLKQLVMFRMNSFRRILGFSLIESLLVVWLKESSHNLHKLCFLLVGALISTGAIFRFELWRVLFV